MSEETRWHIRMLWVWWFMLALLFAIFAWRTMVARPTDHLVLTSPNGKTKVVIVAGDEGSVISIVGSDGKSRAAIVVNEGGEDYRAAAISSGMSPADAAKFVAKNRGASLMLSGPDGKPRTFEAGDLKPDGEGNERLRHGPL